MTPSSICKKYKKPVFLLILILLILASLSLGIYSFYEDKKVGDLITAISVFAVIIGYYLNAEHDREAKRIDIKIQYLSEAYKGIALASNRGWEANEFLTALEKAAAIIQLYGEEEEIRIIREIILILDGKNEQFKSENTPYREDVDNVINLLKNRLRELLSLAPYHYNVLSLRMIRNPSLGEKNNPLFVHQKLDSSPANEQK